MQLHYHKDFLKAFSKLGVRLKKKVKNRLALLVENEIHPLLRNHALHGEYEGCRSINITGDIRVIYERVPDGYHVLDVGSHAYLYG